MGKHFMYLISFYGVLSTHRSYINISEYLIYEKILRRNFCYNINFKDLYTIRMEHFVCYNFVNKDHVSSFTIFI